jgi:hypothetical protein
MHGKLLQPASHNEGLKRKAPWSRNDRFCKYSCRQIEKSIDYNFRDCAEAAAEAR